MPEYEYRCEDCGELFTRSEHISEHTQQTHPRCPKCGSEKVSHVLSPFYAKTSKKS